MDEKQDDTYLAGVRRKEEERSFIRYTGDSECELKIGSETYIQFELTQFLKIYYLQFQQILAENNCSS